MLMVRKSGMQIKDKVNPFMGMILFKDITNIFYLLYLSFNSGHARCIYQITHQAIATVSKA